MFIDFAGNLSQILDWQSSTPLTRQVGDDLFLYAFQNWQSYRESEEEEPDTSRKTRLYFGLGSRTYARNIIQTGSDHRLYEPDPYRLALFLEEFPDFFEENNWKIGTGLFLQEDFFAEELTLQCHPLLKTLYDPLPDIMVKSPDKLNRENGLLIQVGALFYRDILEVIKRCGISVCPLQLGHWSEEGLKVQLKKTAAKNIFSINVIDGLADL
ncbi:MAG: hypothetical protein ACQEP7_04120, partial [bacterium]